MIARQMGSGTILARVHKYNFFGDAILRQILDSKLGQIHSPAETTIPSSM